MNPQTMIEHATDFAIQNDLTVEEAKISQAYIDMLMERAKQDEKTNERTVFDSLHCRILA